MQASSNITLRIQGSNKLLFLCFWGAVALLYAPAYKGGFYEDFLGFIEQYQKLPFTDFIKLTPSSLYLGVNTVHYIFLQLFGTYPLPWFLLFTGLHACSGVILIRFFEGLFKVAGLDNTKPVVYTGILFWLFTPLAAETINWKACSHYLISLLMIAALLKWLIDYLQTSKTKYMLMMLALYTLSTIFLEIFYLTPVFIFIIAIFLFYGHRINKDTFQNIILKIVLPFAAIWGTYYMVLHFVLKRNFARSDVDLTQLLSPSFLLSRLEKYFIHIYSMEYFLPGDKKKLIYRFTELPLVTTIFGVLLLAILIIGLIRYRSFTLKWQTIYILFLLSLTSCIIILPMWFYEDFSYQGSRYYYLPGIFFYMLLSCIIFSGKEAMKLRYSIAGIYLIACTGGTLYIVRNIYIATKTANNLMDSFKWKDTNTVLLLNLPTLYQGIGIIGAGNPSNFKYHLEVMRHDTIKAKIYDVSSFNMDGRWDGAHVKMLDSMHIKVSLNQGATWWWYGGFGALDYENDLYKVLFVDNGSSYILQLKHQVPGSISILYQIGGRWKEVDKSKINIEQW